MKCKNMRATMAGAVLAVVCLTGVRAGADERGLSAAVDATYAGRYIWRGIPVNEEPVLQPSIGLSGGGFSLSVWGNMDLTDWGEDEGGYGDESWDFTELDYAAGYEVSTGKLTFGTGFITYTFPNLTELGAVSTTEAYFGAALDAPLSPSLYTYVDVDGQATEGANYTSLELAHSFELWSSGDVGVGLDVSGRLGYADHKYLKAYYGINEEGDFHDAGGSVSFVVSLPNGFYISPAYAYSALLEGESRDAVDGSGLDRQAGIFMLGMGWWAGEI